MMRETAVALYIHLLIEPGKLGDRGSVIDDGTARPGPSRPNVMTKNYSVYLHAVNTLHIHTSM